MKIINYPERKDWEQVLKRPVVNAMGLEKAVGEILKEVKQNGDKAVIKYTSQFDGVDLEEFLVSEKEILEAGNVLSSDLKKAIATAKNNIEKFHNCQKSEVEKIETTKGVVCWRKSIGIEKVGLYIPGGSAPLFSTVLMLGVPAKIAACKEVILCTPPNKNGKINAAILYTANLVGIKKIYKVGGVQAIAAMAYGTETISKVYKIFGPGNAYVTCAKQLVLNEVAIDMPAGPSEVAVLADESCIPKFVAADLLSQCEHGADSQAVLVSNSSSVIKNVLEEVQVQLKKLPRNEIAQKALQNSNAILVNDLEEGVAILNEYAPEHLIIACKNSEAISDYVINAGSVFLGNYSCESAGDYASGTNHTLPTYGNAKAYSGVSLDSFVKKVTFQQLSKEGIDNLGTTIELMAEAEGLQAHKNAVTLRMNNND